MASMPFSSTFAVNTLKISVIVFTVVSVGQVKPLYREQKDMCVIHRYTQQLDSFVGLSHSCKSHIMLSAVILRRNTLQQTPRLLSGPMTTALCCKVEEHLSTPDARLTPHLITRLVFPREELCLLK